jgi:uncharacterized protein (DUF362 family)/Pyruvate/2-oxoacid:ferredoxin oxidoreductase delta subunit
MIFMVYSKSISAPVNESLIVYIKDASDLEKTIAQVFAACVKIGLKDKRVFVKPNMLRAARPEECVITDPALVQAVVTVLQKMGAQCTVGDNPIPQRVNETQVARECAFLEASRGTFKAIGTKSRSVAINNKNVSEILMSSDILDCDFLISLPKFKTHVLTTLSVAVKNNFGLVPGGLKPYLHSVCSTVEEFSDLLVDIYELRTPDLVIADCLRIHDSRGQLHAPNLIIASADGHALDYVCCRMAGMAIKECPTLQVAQRRGLLDPDKIKIDGPFHPLKKFPVPYKYPLKNILAGMGQRFWARGQKRLVPAIDMKKCTRCMACEQVCPVHAINGLGINYQKCIRCYCCVEICPASAVRRRLRL